MTDLRKAAKLALEALEDVFGLEKKDVSAINALRQALAQEEQEPSANKYNGKRIAWELERTALGDGHFGNALYVAMDMPQTTKADKEMLHRYMCGSNLKTDHIKLQDLAMRIYTAPVDAVNMSQELVDETAKGEHEPVCFLRETNWSYEIAPWGDPNGFPVYTAPPVSDYHEGWEEGFKAAKSEWVGLSDEEVIKCFDSVAFGQVEDDLIINKHVNIFRAIHSIEAKLKEKNT